MPTNTYAQIRAAILERKQIHGDFQGYHREMCPHVIGIGKEGQEQALFWQFAGGSKTGLPPGGMWRCMAVSELTGVTVHTGEWHTGGSHTQPQSCVKQVDVEVPH